MKPGDPFHTKDLDRRRADQRRLLRMIDSDTVTRIGRVYNVAVEQDPNCGLVETELRDLADAERTVVGDELLASMAAIEAAAHLTDLLSYYINEISFRSGPSPGQPDVTELRRRYMEARTADPLNEVADEQAEAVKRMVLFLMWADEYADDGYRDPRIPDPQQRR